jgi:glycerol-3-phosphate dehydrogenase
MPIVAAVDALLKGAMPIGEVLEQLMARPPRPEAH